MTDDEKKAEEDKALKTAKEVIKKLNDGAKFEDLAKEYSADGSKDKGGDLGYFNKGDMVSEFETAAFKLKLNKYTTEPVKSQFGYHIILKTGEKEKAELKDVKEEIKTTLANEKKNNDTTVQVDALVELRKSMGMSIEDDELEKQYSTYISNLILQSQQSAN